MKNWIKANNYKEVHFPLLCPYTEKEPDTTKRYVVSDDSLLMQIIGNILRFDRIIIFEIPYHSSGIKDYRKKQTKAIFRGLLWGALMAIAFMVLGVAIAVQYRENQLIERIGIIVGGVGFVGNLIVFPIFHYIRSQKKIETIKFKNKSEELWVKIRNENYKKEFLRLNEPLIQFQGK
ncbi:hypothetical protein [uncultured Croceitalea sp.]|uniref:hypothetical protein n=1 Tax=uncultured Croceitalea sp. TaxID=1798908 RepID=UPI003305F553